MRSFSSLRIRVPRKKPNPEHSEYFKYVTSFVSILNRNLHSSPTYLSKKPNCGLGEPLKRRGKRGGGREGREGGGACQAKRAKPLKEGEGERE